MRGKKGKLRKKKCMDGGGAGTRGDLILHRSRVNRLSAILSYLTRIGNRRSFIHILLHKHINVATDLCFFYFLNFFKSPNLGITTIDVTLPILEYSTE